jgi:hypothetical protein
MPIATKLESPRATEPRAILKPGGNIVTTVHEETTKRKKENLKKKTQGPRKQVPEICDSVVVGSTNKVSSDTTCSSDSSSSGNNSLVKKVNALNGNGTSAKMKRNGFKMKTDGSHVSPCHKDSSAPSKRCDWITPNSGKSLPLHLRSIPYYSYSQIVIGNSIPFQDTVRHFNYLKKKLWHFNFEIN